MSARLLGSITAQAPSSLILVPELLQALVIAAERGWQVRDSLRFVAVGGALVSAACSSGPRPQASRPSRAMGSANALRSSVSTRRLRIAQAPWAAPAARGSADRRSGAGPRAWQRHARLPGRSAGPRRCGNRDRRPRRIRCRRLSAATGPCGQPLHHQLRAQRFARVDRERDFTAARRQARAGLRRGAALRGGLIGARERCRRCVDRTRRCGGQRNVAGLRAGAALGAQPGTFQPCQRPPDRERPAAPRTNPCALRRPARRALPTRPWPPDHDGNLPCTCTNSSSATTADREFLLGAPVIQQRAAGRSAASCTSTS